MDLYKQIDQKLKKTFTVLSCKDLITNYDFDIKKEYFDVTRRKYNKKIIYKNDLFEIILIKWDKDSETPIHSHPKNGCLLKLIKGKLLEEKYIETNEGLRLFVSNNLKIGETNFMHDIIGQHKIIAVEESYSIHLYSPPGFYN